MSIRATALEHRSKNRLEAALLAIVAFAVVALGWPSPATAHPADELLQHLHLDIRAERIDLTISIGGGVLAKELLISALDADESGVASADEISAWTHGFIGHLSVAIDGRPVLLDPAKASVAIPPLDAFHLGVEPIVVTYQLPVRAEPGVEQRLVVTNRYRELRSAYTVDLATYDGMGIVSAGWPWRESRISFGLGIGTPAEPTDRNATALASTALGAKVASMLGRERTPGFFLVLLGTFVAVGALHAAQPGHGKALVAGYLVATQGTMRDALTLASIVTFTHTAGVFLLGGATIAASAVFLPSRVVPAMQIVSAILVIVLGANLLRRAVANRREARPEHRHHHHHQHDFGAHAHHHDHAHLTDEEHARLHLEEALAVRSRARPRDLLTLGIAGGIVPCPEALAILLLAIGLHQAWLGMLAIVAFSAGLAAVLVAFGGVVALVGARSARIVEFDHGSRTGALVRVAARSVPLVSAALITLVGVVMLLSEVATIR